MTETRLYPRSGRRSIISVPDLLVQEGENALVCVPIPALEIVRKLVRHRGYWRTSYAQEYFEDKYELPSDVDFDAITAMLDLFLEATTDMDCGDLTARLTDIGSAIDALALGGGCGCGSAGGGATSPADEPLDTGDITEPTGDPPDGYDTWSDYQVVKCDIAAWIVQNLIDDVNWFQVIQIATLTLGGLSAGLLSVLSAFTLTAILAMLLAILAYEVSMLEEASDLLEEHFDEIKCAIMAGVTAADSMANFKAEIGDHIDADVADPISRFLLKSLLDYFADAEQFNLLYEPFEVVQGRQIPGGSDCVDCGISCGNFTVETGTWEGGLDFASEPFAGFEYVIMAWNTNTDACNDQCGGMETHSLKSLTGWSDPSGSKDYFRIWQDSDCPTGSDNATVYSSKTQMPLDEQYCGRQFSIYSLDPFTMTLERFGECS